MQWDIPDEISKVSPGSRISSRVVYAVSAAIIMTSYALILMGVK
jgi:hypothetical protein